MLAAEKIRLVVRKQLLWEKLKIRTLKKFRFLSKIKLRPPIETVRSLNFWASTPTLYVRNKMAEASLLPQKEGKKIFLGHSRVFLLDFLRYIEWNKPKIELDPEVVPEGQ